MGLLELLQQGQTQLSAGSFPGDTPIYDPQSGFVQSNLSTNTYESETIGQPNNGSALANTLGNTALDNTEGESTTNVFPPQSNQPYPFLASGIFGYAATQFTEPYGPTGNGTQGYYWFSNINEIVNIETNPQVLTLAQTSLDNTESDSISATVNPLYIQTSYPFFARGKWRANASQFPQLWNSDFGYALNFYSSPSSQQSTLNKTSLDNTIYESENTTYPIPNATSYPNDYPALASGEFNGAPSQYESPYSSTNTYLNNISIEDQNSPQLSTLGQTGLDNTDTNSEQTSVTPNSISSPNNYPSLVSGEFGGAPSPYESQYNVENTYLNSIDDINNTPQATSLFSTGLDNTNTSAEPTTVVPSNISFPNNYPQLVSGEFNGAPSQYESPYNVNDTYLDSVSIQDPNSPQLPTLEETGLDLTNEEHSPTTIVPDSTAYPNNYPAIEGVNLGGFGGPEQYDTNWNQENTYLNSFNPDSENSIQLSFTGSNLDNSSTGVSTLSHVIPPTSVYKPNDYPIIPTVNLGEFNSGPSQYTTPYTPNEPYLGQYNEIKNVDTNPQTNTLDETALDVENSAALPSSLLFAPTNPDDITVYPSANVTGVTGSAPQPFNQVWRPSNKYYSYMKENYEVR